MIPTFGAMLMLFYEWYQRQSETRFLVYSIVCLVGGVIFGTLIVGASSSSEKEENKDAGLPEETLTPLGDLSNSAPHLGKKPAPVVSEIDTAATPDPIAEPETEEDSAISIHFGGEAPPTNSEPEPTNVSAPASGLDEAFTRIFGDEPTSAPSEEEFLPMSEVTHPMSEEEHKQVAAQIAAEDAFSRVLSSEELEPQQSAPVNAQEVEKAQQVVARLEAEVARAEVVAKKLEVERKKADSTASKLQANKDKSCEAPSAPSAASSTYRSGPKNGNGKKPEPKTIEECFALGEKYMAESNLDEAFLCYEKATKLENRNFEGWYMRGMVLRKKGRDDDALYCFNYAIGINDKSPLAHAEKGNCLLAQKKIDQALISFDKSLSLDKVAPKSWLGKARCFAAMGKHKDAIACFDKVLAMQADNEEAKAEKRDSAAKLAKA